ncbi:hypothetical protein HPB47_024639 [Ixodes persulcatus]|uniref:Uncharacterized protein n=1 Tax=Ixodes persulcatus TaxID=34615 RepID=A0AC60Q467_IXOPE|nr:hypothetical protein HPB47_024639 [Ixodes persulcatus]
MDLEKLRVPELVHVCTELGIDLGQAKRKPHIIKLIRAAEISEEELLECVELKREKEFLERDKEERETKRRADELELRKVELEMRKLEAQSPAREVASVEPTERFKMKDLLQPYKLGEDIGLFLVNFERTCEKVRFQRETWPQKLLTLLPCEAADVIARLTREDADNYDQVKAALLKKYRLSTEAFRQRFRQASRKPAQSYPEFAYNLRADLVEWLKSAGAHGDHDKVVECIATEQFFRELPEAAMFWVQDRLTEPNLLKAAELAEEHAMRRALKQDRPGPFGVLETEAAVSSSLPLPYPYLFSNKSEQLLLERGLSFSHETVLALTRSKARALAGQLQYDSVDGASSSVKPSDQPDLPGEFDSAPGQNTEPEIERGERTADHGKGDGILLSPASTSFQALAGLDRPTLIAEQESDPSLRDLHKSEKEGVANKNIAFQTRSGVLYRQSGAKPSHSSRASAARREVNRQNAGALLDNSTISSKYPGFHECVLTSQLMFRREIKSGAEAKSELSDCGFEKTLESGDQGFSGESGTENRLGTHFLSAEVLLCRTGVRARRRLGESFRRPRSTKRSGWSPTPFHLATPGPKVTLPLRPNPTHAWKLLIPRHSDARPHQDNGPRDCVSGRLTGWFLSSQTAPRGLRGNPFGQRAFVASSQLDNEGPEKQVSLPSCPTGGISANPGRWLDGALLTRRQGHRIASLWVYGDSSADNETQWCGAPHPMKCTPPRPRSARPSHRLKRTVRGVTARPEEAAAPKINSCNSEFYRTL